MWNKISLLHVASKNNKKGEACESGFNTKMPNWYACETFHMFGVDSSLNEDEKDNKTNTIHEEMYRVHKVISISLLEINGLLFTGPFNDSLTSRQKSDKFSVNLKCVWTMNFTILMWTKNSQLGIVYLSRFLAVTFLSMADYEQ